MPSHSIESLAAENAELRRQLAALEGAVRSVPQPFSSNHEDADSYCVYCFVGWPDDVHSPVHADDCPYAALQAMVPDSALAATQDSGDVGNDDWYRREVVGMGPDEQF